MWIPATKRRLQIIGGNCKAGVELNDIVVRRWGAALDYLFISNDPDEEEKVLLRELAQLWLLFTDEKVQDGRPFEDESCCTTYFQRVRLARVCHSSGT